ncbi:hypothetical protein [Puia dinghuensis]|uniref:NodB homology domain-containing protein n=1 Tax=Puia dinghuensis TaxID=1792502 RepID=A0A8J2UEW6_9BACT|nr:hypothetical protein [Puia dinghuensis]GGB08517.1 hypothetical protein GCM10011511_34990 [Puia dinghuensis]
MKLVLFTFDYELFLGERSGTPAHCILSPTDKLLGLFGRFGFKAIFFVDTTYLLRLEEVAARHPAAAADLEAIRDQLKTMVRQGHYIFPHLHPHWLDAVYLPESNEWSLKDTRYYALSSISAEQRQRLFDHSVQTLGRLAASVLPDYRLDAYRAGGWSIQPFEDFRPLFLRHGIVHEWSVIPGKYLYSDAHSFDFRHVPAIPVYRFDKDVCREDEQGPFREWTISCLPMTRRQRWLDFKFSGLLHRMGKITPLPGTTVSSTISKEGDALAPNGLVRLPASFERLNPYRLRKFRKAMRRISYYQFISHPKMLTPYDFKLVERLFRTLKKDKAVETDFRQGLQP